MLVRPAYHNKYVPYPMLTDCMGQADAMPMRDHLATWAICITAGKGFEGQLRDALESLIRYGEVHGARIVVFNINNVPDIAHIAAYYGAVNLPLWPTGKVTAAIKAALYGAPRYVHADYFLCLDCDLIVVDSLRPLMQLVEHSRLENLERGRGRERIFAAMSGQTEAGIKPDNFAAVARGYYGAKEEDIEMLSGALDKRALDHFFHLNSGVFAGSALAFQFLDSELRAMKQQADVWLEARRQYAADELLFSMAVARMGCLYLLDKTWNLLLYSDSVQSEEWEMRSQLHVPYYKFSTEGSDAPVRILHFAASSRNQYPEYKKLMRL